MSQGTLDKTLNTLSSVKLARLGLGQARLKRNAKPYYPVITPRFYPADLHQQQTLLNAVTYGMAKTGPNKQVQ